MKKNVLYIFMLVALVLAACAPAAGGGEPAAPADGEEPAASAEGEMSERCGDTSKLADEIFLYNWSEYIDPDIMDQFEAECGVKVVETNFDSNETLLATLQAGGADYDIIVPSDYMVTTLIDEGMVMELDYSVITNIANMDPINVNQYFDPEQKYTIPWFWGTSGYAVDTNVVTEYSTSWSTLFDPNSPFCGQISMLDDQRETIGAALMYLGYSINDIDPAHLEEAKNLLIEQSKCVKAYDSQTNDDLIVSGETVLSHIWTGDALLAGDPEYGGRDGIVYVIPDEGCTIWQDNMMVPINAPNSYTAMVFMNYTQFPEIAAQNAEWVGYATPNAASKEFIDPEMLANESVYPSEETSARLQWIEDVGNAYELYDRIWTEFKAAAGS
ncbi:MAG TPA: spermidine/putrescine ABC transporter substrate-binding protein [Anaerolineales bacterium]|nr:spermidine/putrescine ABC transporter substrate-binding protein [Anaerolineales bacterium]